jgi:hypothetical protein
MLSLGGALQTAPAPGPRKRNACGRAGAPEIYKAPRTWAERAYPKLIYFNEVDRGCHFAAWQEPALFTTEVRAAFRTLR